jgi:stalled ribosome rescue protein Dom34
VSKNYVVWLDRKEARIFHVSPEKMERKVIHARLQDQLEHESPGLYQEVVDRLADADQLLILGPGMTKKHFESFIREHAARLVPTIVGCETVDHPTDPEIAAYALRFFSSHSEAV